MQQPTIVERRQRRHQRRRRPVERFEHSDMEDVVDSGTVRQPKAIRHPPDALHHLKWSCVPRAQLTTQSRKQGLCRPVKETKLNPVVDGELQQAVVNVIILLRICLSLQKTIPNIGDEGVTVAQQRVDRLCSGRPCSIWHKSGRRAPVHHLKRRGLERSVVHRVVTILGPRQPFQPLARPIP
jgi:hypothetical protein